MFQMLRKTRTSIEAELLISRLRAAGLHPNDLRVWPHVTLAGGELFYDVEVPVAEVEAANQVIRARDASDEPVSPTHSAQRIMRMALVLIIVAIAAGMLLP